LRFAADSDRLRAPIARRSAAHSGDVILTVTNNAPVATTVTPGEAVICKPLEVTVGDKGIERAIKNLKRKMAAEGVLRELKRRRHYMKPSVKRRKKASEAARRRRKRSRLETAG
jgi:small subunit ribosomal protein S21